MTQHDLNLNLKWLTDEFAPITLAELNSKSAMLSRIDNKYVVQAEELKLALPELAKKFDVLDIEKQRAFTYDTRYFDDAERSAYYEHHQGLRKGFKVRIRRYADAGLCFLEVKVKGKRGMTEKFRLPYDPKEISKLSQSAKDFACETYSRQYGKPFCYDLRRVLDIRYKRITLVAKTGGERMTVDTELQFWSDEKYHNVGSGIFIVETKSKLGRGNADKCLRHAKVRLTKRCSKYCIGMATLGQVSRFNRFLPAMKKLNLSGTRAPIRAELERKTASLLSDIGSAQLHTFAAKNAAAISVSHGEVLAENINAGQPQRT